MYLAADIGATNARFQLGDLAGLQGPGWSANSADYANFAELLDAACQALDAGELQGAVLAVAGPVNEQGVCQMTNVGLEISAVESQKQLKCPVRVINDFYAQAASLPYLKQLLQIGGGAVLDETKVVVGPGSGLGVATLVRVDDAWQAISGEGGHADFAPASHLETELWQILVLEHGHVSWETVLSGPGLVNLYRAMCATWGQPPEELNASDIAARGVEMADLVCHQTLETFAALLGGLAGNLALTLNAQGGVYIGGGIAPRLKEFLPASPLRRRFEEKGAMSKLVADIPLLVITEDNPGLVGARACFAHLAV